MTDLRTAAQQALEALELVVVDVKTTPTAYEAQRQAIAALRAALAEPVQVQPTCDECGRRKADGWALYCVDCLEPMFAQRKPLTPEQILDLFDAQNVYGSKWLEFARAIEAAHGIGGQP